jgi:hypothetical protein
MNEFWSTITALGTAIVTVAIVAVIVSKNAQTSNVIQAAGSAFGNSLNVAVSPVTGNNTQGTLAYPSSSGSALSSLSDLSEMGEFG